MNDAPRRWWNILDKALRSYGMIPTRADRCCYVLYEDKPEKKESHVRSEKQAIDTPNSSETAVEYIIDPVTGSQAHGRTVVAILNLHVDDLFGTGGPELEEKILKRIRKDFQVGSEDWNEVTYVGQRIRWKTETLVDGNSYPYIAVDQQKDIDAMEEIVYDKKEYDSTRCDPGTHTAFRSALGVLNWLQSRTQFHVCYKFSRSASAAAGPTIGDVKVLNKTIRQLKAEPVVLRFWPLRGPLRLIGYPDASYRNNEDKSSQRAHVVFLGEQRNRDMPSGNSYGSLIDYESQKIKRTVLSTTVSELYSFMKCFGTCQFLKGL